MSILSCCEIQKRFRYSCIPPNNCMHKTVPIWSASNHTVSVELKCFVELNSFLTPAGVHSIPRKISLMVKTYKILHYAIVQSISVWHMFLLISLMVQ